MKQCYKCKIKKTYFEFYKDPHQKDGYQNRCKLCDSEYKKSIYPKKREIRLLSFKKNYVSNKSAYNVRQAKRRATKIQRTPKWIKDVFVDEIKIIYKRAQTIKAFTGEVWHVDHIIPLQGKLVSGLHVPWNLQLLPAEENLSKGNRFSPH